jgi:hypothetical protein
MKNKKDNNNENFIKLSEKIRETFQNKDYVDQYKNSFLINLNEERDNNFITTKFKREQLLSMLMNEFIPTPEIIKKALEKENDQLLKEENKEIFFQTVFQNIYNTLSPQERECLKKNQVREDILKQIIGFSDIQNKFQSKDNNLIYSLCHNFMTFDDIEYDNLV